MKRFFAFVTVAFLVAQAWAQTADYLQQKDFQTEKKKIQESIGSVKRQLNEIRKEDARTVLHIDSLRVSMDATGTQLKLAYDSLSRTAAKLNTLQEKVESEKQLSQGVIIASLVVLLVLALILFILLFSFRKLAKENRQAIEGLEKKLADFIEPGLKDLQGDIRGNRDAIRSTSAELGEKISTGLGSLESREDRLEQREQEDISGIGARMEDLGLDLARIREDLARVSKSIDERLDALRKETESGDRELAARAGRLEEEFRAVKKK